VGGVESGRGKGGDEAFCFRFRTARYKGKKTIISEKTPIAQSSPLPIEYPRFWESKKTHRAAAMGMKKRRIFRKPPLRKGFKG
jgi:hypothetical protein